MHCTVLYCALHCTLFTWITFHLSESNVIIRTIQIQKLLQLTVPDLSLIFALNCFPSRTRKSLSGCRIPHLLAIDLAVFTLSPVTIRTTIPALWHFLIASGTCNNKKWRIQILKTHPEKHCFSNRKKQAVLNLMQIRSDMCWGRYSVTKCFVLIHSYLSCENQIQLLLYYTFCRKKTIYAAHGLLVDNDLLADSFMCD